MRRSRLRRSRDTHLHFGLLIAAKTLWHCILYDFEYEIYIESGASRRK